MKVSFKRTLYLKDVVAYCESEGLMNLAYADDWDYIKYCLGCGICGCYVPVNVTPEILLDIAQLIIERSTRSTLDIRDVMQGLDMYISNSYYIH